MIFNIHVKPNARKEMIEEKDGLLKVSVKAPAVEGKANEAVVALLAKHFSVSKSAVHIIRGIKGRKKMVEIKLPTSETNHK